MKETKEYKQTELGLLPEDWKIKRIIDIATITTGSQNTQDKVDGGEYPFYVRSQNVERIDTYIYDTDGVVTAGDGVGTGKIFHRVRGKFGLHQRCYLMHNLLGVNADYFYWIFSIRFYERVMSMTAKSSVDSVRREMIADMLLPLPPIEEQRRIASALTNIDNLIESLDRLIAKKRNIKQGAMQQLLSGKKRLKGFTEPWVEKKLGDVFDIKAGGDVVTSDFSPIKFGEYNYPIYSNSLDNRGLYGYTRTPRCPANSITITGRGTLGHAEYRNHEYDAVIRIIILIPKAMEIDCNCISSLINSQRPFIFESTGVPQLTVPQVSDSCIMLPPSLPEQQAIASVLTSMDNELSALEAKRKKYEQIKQGMMQQLLTGRVRLKNASSVHSAKE